MRLALARAWLILTRLLGGFVKTFIHTKYVQERPAEEITYYSDGRILFARIFALEGQNIGEFIVVRVRALLYCWNWLVRSANLSEHYHARTVLMFVQLRN